jgi:hypothetical protein
MTPKIDIINKFLHLMQANFLCGRISFKGKKVKVYPTTCREGPEREWRYSSTLSLISALDGMSG